MQQQGIEEYDNRVNEILEALASGKTRDAVAKEFGHSNYKTIDMYMRRRSFRWDSANNTYISKIQQAHQLKMDYRNASNTSKAMTIISRLNEENADIRSIAESMGFSDHKEMASYMRSKGYIWDTEMNNYAFIKAPVSEPEEEISQQSHMSAIEADRYLPILEMLVRNKDKLSDMFADEDRLDAAKIPRYIIPGVFTTKSVHMVSRLDDMVKEFSREKNISQREIFEVALIQFFEKYGYEREVKELLNK